MRIALQALVLALVVPALARAADLTVRQQVTATGPRTDTHEVTEYITATRRITDDPGHRTIVDLDAKTITMVDKAKHTYTVTTFDDLRQQMERASKRIDALPPEARKMLGGMSGDVTLEPTGRTERIAGYEAKEYAIRGGAISGSVWATDAITVPAKAADWERFRGAVGGPQGPGSRLGEAMAKLKGFSLRTQVRYSLGPMTGGFTTEVLSVSEQAPPPDVTEVPATARKVAPGAPGE